MSLARRIPRPSGASLVVPALALLSYALAFAQHPGKAYSDSRAELTVNPGLFLERVTSTWSSTADLGHFQSSQFVGYLTPMAPWFAGADALGIPMWIAQRLWLGTLLALAAWGAVRLMDALYDPRRGVAHALAGLLYAANPYVVVYADFSSVTLLAYAALPWLMLAARRGVEEPRRWRWPLVAGAVFALSAGGVNAAVVAWTLVAPAALVVYELALRRTTVRAVFGFVWRAAICLVVASLWWVVPTALNAAYGAPFLDFTEQPLVIWYTPSMAESLRLLGYWLTYFATGFDSAEPTMQFAATYLFQPFVILATFAVPLAALGGLVWTRRWTYAPFFALLAVFALVIMSAGFPEAKPLNRLLTSAYYDVPALQFLRTTYKAAPLAAIAIACLGGASAAWLVDRMRAARERLPAGEPHLAAWALVPLALIPVLWALPLFTGGAVNKDLAYDKVPQPWRQTMSDADRALPANQRMLALPGQMFGYYQWGRTLDPVPPALTRRPVLIRSAARFASPAASQLQTVVDDAIQQQRLVPGQLPPLLRLMGVGQVIVATDGRPEQTGELDPAQLARVLAAQPGFAHPVAQYGPRRTFAPARARGGDPVVLPQLRRYPGPPGTPGIVRLHPQARPTVIDGDADGVVQAAAHPGGLDPSAALFYAGDLDAATLRDRLAHGARLVFTDSNRRRAVNPTRITENRWPTIGPDDSLERLLASYRLFTHGSDDQTVALFSGLRYLHSPRSLTFAVFPEHRPYAAFDGQLDRPWIADAQKLKDRWLEVGLARPRMVGSIQVQPHEDALGRATSIAVSVNGGPEAIVALRPGWNKIPIRQRVDRLRLRIAQVSGGIFAGRGGLDEVQIPGVHPEERLRLPTRTAGLLRGADLSRNPVEVMLQRTTADVPYRAGADVVDPQAENRIHMIDAEPGLKRRVTLPSRRKFTLGGWASVAPNPPAGEIDRLAGVPLGWVYGASSTFEGVPGQRASSAFDRSSRTAWVGDWNVGQPAWIAVRAPLPFLVGELRIRGDAHGAFATPSRVAVTTDAGPTGPLPVDRDGTVRLPAPVLTRSVRVDILAVANPTGLAGARLLSGVAINELTVPGLPAPRPRRRGRFTTPCGSLTVRAGKSTVRARVRGTISQLDAGAPLPIEACGGRRALRLQAGQNDIDAPPGSLLRPDQVRLVSAPASPRQAASPPAPRVVDVGKVGDTKIDGARLDVTQPSWLVLAESYSTGWRAWCRDRAGKETALGTPKPIDAYGNGWLVDRGCVTARFAFAPQATANASYMVSAAGGLLALLLGAGAWLMRRRRGRGGLAEAAPVAAVRSPSVGDAPLDPLRRLSWPRALALAAVVGASGGFVFAWRAGAVLFVVTLLLALLGTTVRRLLAIAAAAFAVVPVVYLVDPAPDLGGAFFSYAYWHLTAHWVATAGVCAVAAAAVLDLRALRRRRESAPAGGQT